MIGVRARPLVCAAAIILSSLLLFAGKARAAPLTVRLEYRAGPGCPDAADFKAVVIARLGYDPFVESAPEQVLVRIDPGARAIDGRIEWRDANGSWAGEQSFPSVSTDCPHLVRTMGFALAVQIQLLAKANAAAPNANGASPAETAPASDAAKAPTVPERPIPAPPPQEAIVATAGNRAPAPAGAPGPVVAMGAGPSVGLGMSSSPVLLGRLFGAVQWPHLSIELAAVVSLPATTRRPDGAGVSQQILLGGAAACATAVRWSACLVGSAGAVRMAGENIDRPTAASVPILQAGARLGFRQDLGRRVFLSLRADGLLNLVRWTGSLDQVPVWTAPRTGAAIGFDAGFRFE